MAEYSELIKALRHCIDPDTACDGCPQIGNNGLCADMLYVEAADAIEELQAEAKKWESCTFNEQKEAFKYLQRCRELESSRPHWVSVEERLPNDGDTVLIYCENTGGIVKSHYREFVSAGKKHSLFSGGAHFVKYWMPLPEPPQEVQDADK